MKKVMIGLVIGVAVGAGGMYVFNKTHPAAAEQPGGPGAGGWSQDGQHPGGHGGMNMQPMTPPALTDAQNAQLKAGAAPHAPTELAFNVNGGNFYFVPNEIRVKKGDK